MGVVAVVGKWVRRVLWTVGGLSTALIGLALVWDPSPPDAGGSAGAAAGAAVSPGWRVRQEVAEFDDFNRWRAERRCREAIDAAVNDAKRTEWDDAQFLALPDGPRRFDVTVRVRTPNAFGGLIVAGFACTVAFERGRWAVTALRETT